MDGEHTINGLLRMRAALTGEIDHMSSLVKEKLIALDHLDATIRIFAPDIDLEEVRPKPIPPRCQANPGEMIRAVFTVLREATVPMTSPEITMLVMKMRSMNTADKGLVRTVSKRIIACLRHNRHLSRLKSTKHDGQMLLWEIAR